MREIKVNKKLCGNCEKIIFGATRIIEGRDEELCRTCFNQYVYNVNVRKK